MTPEDRAQLTPAEIIAEIQKLSPEDRAEVGAALKPSAKPRGRPKAGEKQINAALALVAEFDTLSARLGGEQAVEVMAKRKNIAGDSVRKAVRNARRLKRAIDQWVSGLERLTANIERLTKSTEKKSSGI